MNSTLGTAIIVVLAIATITVPSIIFIMDKYNQNLTGSQSSLLGLKLRMTTCFLGGLLALAVGTFADLSSDFGQNYGKIFIYVLGGLALVSSALFFAEYYSSTRHK